MAVISCLGELVLRNLANFREEEDFCSGGADFVELVECRLSGGAGGWFGVEDFLTAAGAEILGRIFWLF